MVVPAAIVAVVIVVALLMFGGGSSYTVTATFENAGQLVKGNNVEIAGRPIGKVKSIELDSNAQARVKLEVGSGFDPLHEGTTAVIRAASLSGIANRYVELHPGPNSSPKIDDGGVIASDKTQAPVDLDQLFNTLDPKTRKGLQDIIQGGAAQYGGKSKQAAEAIRYFNPAISTSARVARELVVDRQAFQRFVTQTAETVSALDARRTDLAALVGNANATTKAIGDENVALGRALGLLPDTLRRANTTFVNLRATLDDLDVLVNESKPATKDLAPLFRKLRPLVADSRPTIRDLRLLIRKKGKNNDLIELTAKMPKLAKIAEDTFPHNIDALNKSLPVISYIRPYMPDFTGWITKFGEGTNPYDANGHYARIQPIFNQFQYGETPAGPTLTPLPDETAGRNGLNARNSLRCPGGAVQPAPDGSNPWPDDAPGCDPTNVPPGP
ncbi:MAG: phospholipid/cholesterol/gamma-HCH transport system substrate-binding protein [Thermoleophilaceae bacterium]|nr:phospholipid/cholesterol/gamma-HCH transport system substrate-binding protein [Thermoleophilaceae bacterium]